MILASGARGREFDSRNTPLLEIFWSFFIYGCRNHLKWAKWAATRSQYWPCISLKIFESFCLKSPSSIWTVIFTPSPQKPPSSSDFLGFWRPNHLLQNPPFLVSLSQQLWTWADQASLRISRSKLSPFFKSLLGILSLIFYFYLFFFNFYYMYIIFIHDFVLLLFYRYMDKKLQSKFTPPP